MQTIAPTALVPARLELHYAAQIVAAAADAWLPERADDGHTAMTWKTPILLGESSPTEVTIGIRAVDFAVIAYKNGEPSTYPLAGKTLAEAMAWADQQFGTPRGIAMRDYDLPTSPLAIGGHFVGHEPELAELARWYDIGFAVLSTVVEPTELRVWPHHFDLGAIIVLDDARQIGIGLSPGDRYYAEPYFYVTPHPLDKTPLPALAGGGIWRTDEWTGAVLTASAAGDPYAFVTSAIAAARTLL
jgi:hypothetical protein